MGKFIEIGKKLTDETNGIYGAYNPDWVHYNYMYAMQKDLNIIRKTEPQIMMILYLKRALSGITDWETQRKFSPPI